MGHRRSRGLMPALERIEPRELLSAITAILGSHLQVFHPTNGGGGAAVGSQQAGAPAGGNSGAGLTGSNVPPPIGVGPGTPTPRELARERFSAYFSGPMYAAPPRFTEESKILQFRGLGSSTQFHHGDFQMTIIIPKDSNAQIVGAAYLQDRNINSGGALGLDLVADPTSLDKLGRPTRFTFNNDPNIYSGLDFVFTAAGTGTITYAKGAATVVFKGLLYTSGITDPLRNMDLQARGDRLVPRSAP